MTADLTDKLTLDTKDHPELEEHFSRKEPGERCVVRVEGTLDEFNDGKLVISVDDVKVEAYKEKKAKKEQAVEGDPETEESPAVKVAKRYADA